MSFVSERENNSKIYNVYNIRWYRKNKQYLFYNKSVTIGG